MGAEATDATRDEMKVAGGQHTVLIGRFCRLN